MPTADDRTQWATGRLLSTAARLVEHSWNSQLREDRVSHAGLIVLSLLSAGPATQRELAVPQHLTEQTIGRTIAHLESTGHLQRSADEHDRRRRVVRLTDQGRALLDEMYARSERFTDEVLAAGGSDPVQFRAALELLIRTYEPTGQAGSEPASTTTGSP